MAVDRDSAPPNWQPQSSTFRCSFCQLLCMQTVDCYYIVAFFIVYCRLFASILSSTCSGIFQHAPLLHKPCSTTVVSAGATFFSDNCCPAHSCERRRQRIKWPTNGPIMQSQRLGRPSCGATRKLERKQSQTHTHDHARYPRLDYANQTQPIKSLAW
jgi:hypothetical protein